MQDTDAVIVGAGPHGLAAAAHLRRAGVQAMVLGDPMSFWRGMPAGMLLRSNWTATCIAEHDGPLSLDSFCTARGISFGLPVPLNRFLEYGNWVQQQVAPDVDLRHARQIARDDGAFTVTLTDGDQITARHVVVAAGIAPFARRPAFAAGLPPVLVSHTSQHADLSRFSGASVLVVGGGQSALESAALLHESGAQAEVVVRANHLNWLHGGKYHRKLGRLAPLVYAPTDVGPMGLSRVVAVPGLFGRLPRRIQDPLAYRAIRPAGALWLDERLRDVPVALGLSIARIERVHRAGKDDRVRVMFTDGGSRVADHVLLGTGYAVDITRYQFLEPALRARIVAAGGYPVLHKGMESSIPGLFFVGAPAAWSFGPLMRFVAGGWYGGQAVTRAITGHGERGERGERGEPGPRPAVMSQA